MKQLPRQLVENFEGGLCIPWCGAGVSLGSGLPAWSGLVRAMIDQSLAEPLAELPREQADELHFMYENGAFEDVVDFCRESMGEGEYRDFLARTLGRGDPSALHKKIASLPVPAILTSNQDRLLEAALVQVRGELPRVLTSQDTITLWKHLAKRDFFLLKIHGDIVRPDTVVFTARDYITHVFGNLPFMTFLQRMILGHSILFMGTSLKDVYVRRILEETTYITEGVGLPHYALLPNPGSIQAQLLRDKYNIRVIAYDPGPSGDHEGQIMSLLDELCQSSGNST